VKIFVNGWVIPGAVQNSAVLTILEGVVTLQTFIALIGPTSQQIDKGVPGLFQQGVLTMGEKGRVKQTLPFL
jgi:hypothetical protein